jgi:hypothetical protein
MKVLKKKILTEENKIHNIFTERNLLIEVSFVDNLVRSSIHH